MKKLLRATAFLLVTTSVLTSSVLVAPAFADPATDAKFQSIYKTEWDWRQKTEAANEDTPSGDVAAHLPDVSKKAQDAKLAYWRDVLKQLDGVDVKALSPREAENYQVYRFQIETLIKSQVYKIYERPLSGDTSFWGDLAGMARGTFRTEADYRNYISQLNDMPRYFKDNSDNMRAGLKRGFTLPQISLQGRDATITSVLDAKSVEDNIYYQPFKDMPVTIPAAKQAELRKLAAEAITSKVLPAHRDLLKFIRDEYIPGAAKSIAAYDLPDGKAFYQAQVHEYATVDMTPEQIHQIGLDEVAKIKAEMMAIKQEVGFKGDLPAFNNFLRTDPQFYVTKPQDLLDRAAWTAKEFDGKAAQYFGRMPRSRFAIIPVAPELAPFYTGGRGGPGGYWVNTYNLPARPLYSLAALTLHESAPGHAWQMPLASENKSLPPFRQYTYISAYGEGWALYSERLGVEMGMYHTPYERYGMLSYQMWRACRLVVDTGIHAKGWTREQAQNYLLENTALSKHEVTTEVDRYIAWPGQALSYYLGEMAIWKARHKAEAALGEKFDIRQFHDAVLELGSVPLPVLEARIDRFIADGGKGPYADEE
ncbi:hypothetical protein AEAC466_09925 [Asticcacaulis sp. AC466]|uniref:DUF885 domain-containing protein n=1 Tax=Asticcacaulis sp. AC466 TaxID=1282362 RepID=UPI0003C3C968|nr:DUF885 family protein [Asticcacaulis sp. AC466]ESQ84053.1 hypothetical protein AEAC466_09925 [Asticcacaulis sp. AC466]